MRMRVRVRMRVPQSSSPQTQAARVDGLLPKRAGATRQPPRTRSHTCMHMYACMRMGVHVHVHAYGCVGACMWPWVHACRKGSHSRALENRYCYHSRTTYLLAHPLTHSPTHSLTHSPTHPLTHPPTHPLTHPLTHSLTHSPTHPLTHPLTRSLIHPLTRSLIHPLAHSPPLSSLDAAAADRYGLDAAATAQAEAAGSLSVEHRLT